MSQLIEKNDEFVLDFTDTAISKEEMVKLQKIFTDANTKYEKNARIQVNSIIPEEKKEEKTVEDKQTDKRE